MIKFDSGIQKENIRHSSDAVMTSKNSINIAMMLGHRENRERDKSTAAFLTSFYHDLTYVERI